MKISLAIALAGLPRLWAQSPLSLAEAVQTGLEHNPAIEASSAGKDAAQSRIQSARSGLLPKLTYSESYQRSDNPVFVFGSLLTQHQFKQENFDLGALNSPNFLMMSIRAGKFVRAAAFAWDAGKKEFVEVPLSSDA